MSDQSGTYVRRAGAEDASLLVEILADALAEDPVLRWISANSAYSRRAWLQVVRSFLPHQGICLTEDGLGASIWVPPGTKPNIRPSPAMLWSTLRLLGIGPIARSLQYMSHVKKYRLPEDFYLFALGVRAGSRGKGIGSNLLMHGLHECDRRRVGAYLETSTARNVAFYQRHGFQVRDNAVLPHNGPEVWLMRRDHMSSRA